MMDYLSKIADKTIYCSNTHEIITREYYSSVNQALNTIDIQNMDLLYEVLNIIIDYYNDFADKQTGSFFYEWLRIIPTNFTYAIAGYIAGLNSKDYNIKHANANVDIMLCTNKYLERLNDLKASNE